MYRASVPWVLKLLVYSSVYFLLFYVPLRLRFMFDLFLLFSSVFCCACSLQVFSFAPPRWAESAVMQS